MYPRFTRTVPPRGIAVEQYAGRLNRDYAGKENVIVYDYVDAYIPNV